MDRRSFVSSVSALGLTTALTRPDRAGALAAGSIATSSVPTLPRTNIAIKTRYAPIPPFDPTVFARRLERARQLTHDAGGSVLFATSGATNFSYLVGSNFGRSERLIALLLPVDGAPVLIAPSFEVERVRRGSHIDASVRGWEEQENPFALVRDALRQAGSTSPAIVVEPKTDYWAAMSLSQSLPDAKLLDGSSVFEELRLVKSPEEIVRMRRAI